MDIQLGLQQSHANSDVWLWISAKLHSDHVRLEKLEVGKSKQLLRTLVMIQDDASNREIDRIDDRQGNNAEVVAFDMAQQFMQRADTVLHEDAELTKARPIATAGGRIFGLCLASVTHRRSP